ncbi:hypothetical protein DFJ77DRAFT_447994 [Powellomyces hirtus]|nr:hypothetical protein DFJ77DRAFT_447994 [Powellomyces hirtus]
MRVRLRLGAKFLGFCFFLVPVFFLHYSLSKSRSESTIRGNPNVARWTSWEPADALPKECDNAWQEQPDADSFRASLGGTETGALILPWLDEEHIITSPSKIICGWVVVKGVRGHFTVQGQAYSGRRREDTPTATGPFSEDLTNLNSTPDFPPDGILIRAIGIQNGFESTMDVSETFAAFEYDRIEYRLYHTTIKLRDADKYKLEVLLEYRSIENLGNLRSVVAPPLQLPTIVSKDGQTLLHTIQIPGKRISRSTYLGLPHCMGADHAGRWVNASFLEKSAGAASWASDEEEVHEDLSEPLESYDGRVWVPYECRYRRWTHKAFKNKCLAKWHNLTHWIGDSNIKRSLKAVTTGGAWCREWYDEGSPECQCEDKALVVPQISENVPSWNLISNVAGKSDVTMLYASLKSLNPSAHKSWSWTDTQDLKADLQNSGSYPAVIELDYPSVGSTSVRTVYVSQCNSHVKWVQRRWLS